MYRRSVGEHRCHSRPNEFLIMKYKMHGMSRSPEYRAWERIIQRCTNSNNPDWSYYGGKGITVFEGWIGDFPSFLADVGLRPSSDHEIDRIDNERGYEPGNVHWIVRKDHRTKHSGHLKQAAQINADRMKQRTHCINGHEFTKENTYVNRDGFRSCKICRKAADRRRRERRRKVVI